MILNDRRRPTLPTELVGRVGAIWLAVSILQVSAAAIAARMLPAGSAAPVWTLATLASVLTLGCAMLLIGRIAYKVFDEEIAGLACLASAVAVPLMIALRPGLLDVHGPQAVCLLFALNGLMAREARYGGWTVGAAVASALALSLDGAVLALGFVAVAAIKWLRNRGERWWLVHALCAATATVAAILATKWSMGAVAECGALGIAHLAAFAWAAVVVTAVAMVEPHPQAFTVGGLGVAAGGATLLLASWPGGCGIGVSLGFADAEPLWRGGAIFALQALALPLIGFIATLRLARPGRDWLRRWWSDYALLLVLATLASVVDTSAAAAACALAAVPLGWRIREWIRAARNSRRVGRRALALTGVALALAPAMPLSLLVLAAPTYAGALASR